MAFHSCILQYSSLKSMNIYLNDDNPMPNKMNNSMELPSTHIVSKYLNLLVCSSQDPNTLHWVKCCLKHDQFPFLFCSHSVPVTVTVE